MDSIERAQALLAKRNKTIQKESTHISQTIDNSIYNTPIQLAQTHWSAFETPAHIQLINEHLLKLNDGDIKKLMIAMPPRHGKSEIISKYFLAWYIINNPDKRIIFVTYSFEFSSEFGLEVRDIVNELGHDITIRQDMRTKNKFFIKDHRGQVSFTGIGGSITGKGADLLVIDDPIKGAEQALVMVKERR